MCFLYINVMQLPHGQWSRYCQHLFLGTGVAFILKITSFSWCHQHPDIFENVIGGVEESHLSVEVTCGE